MLLFFLCVFTTLCRGYSGPEGADERNGVDGIAGIEGMDAHAEAAQWELERIILWEKEDNTCNINIELCCYTLYPQPYPDSVYKAAATLFACFEGKDFECVFKDHQAEVNARYAGQEKRRQECLDHMPSPSLNIITEPGCAFVGLPYPIPKVYNQFCVKRRAMN